MATVASEDAVNDQPIEITYEHVLADHLAADRLYYRSTLFWKLDKVVALVLLCLGAYLTYAAGVRWWSLIWFPIAIAEWFNLLSIDPLLVWYSFKFNPKFRESALLTFDESGIHFQTNSIESRIRWDFFNSLLENDTLYLLVYGRRAYSVIPKRAFKTKTDLTDFDKLVHSVI